MPREAFRPVIAGMHPDPSICRVGADYYLACSSFEYFPGVPIWHSRDLVTWTLLGNALDRPGQLPLTGVRDSEGVYAPTLRHHDGTYWLVTTVVGRPGQSLFTAADPAGPWSDQVVVDVEGIDPDLAWDDDGSCHLSWSDNVSGSSMPGIKQVPIDPRTGAVLGEPVALWSGTGLQFPEAPHLYRVGDLWYLVVAEGGTGPGHAISVARGRSPQGPFESCPHNPVLTHRSLDHPVQNTGHGDLVQAPDGSWAMVLLGVRRLGIFPGFHILGRETFLSAVTWPDGWPSVELLSGGDGGDLLDRDDFDGPGLAPCWVSVRERPPGSYSLSERPGWLTLSAAGGRSVFLGRRQQHLGCSIRASVESSEAGRAGLRLRLDDDHHVDVEIGGGAVQARVRIGPVTQTLHSVPLPAGPVVLRISTQPNPDAGFASRHPDLVTLAVELGDRTTELAVVDGRYVSTEVAGGFTGRVLGAYVDEGRLQVDWVEYAGSDG